MRAFRKAEVRDLPAIMAVIREAQRFIGALGIDQWQDGYPEEELIREDIRQGIGYVLEEDGVGGYAALLLEEEPLYDAIDGAWLTNGEQYGTMHRTAVGDKMRGSGAATRILTEFEEMARAAGAKSMRADTHRGNTPMNGFLRKRGYARCGEVRYPIEPNDPIRVAYEKML